MNFFGFPQLKLVSYFSFPSCPRGYYGASSFRRVPPTNSFGTHHGPNPYHMPPAKKGATGPSARRKEDRALVIHDREADPVGIKDGEVQDIANGQFKVQLESIGVPPEDITAYRRIEAALQEAAARALKAARAAQPSSSQHNIRNKGKRTEAAAAEAARQAQQLEEEERRCREMQQQLLEKR